MTGSAILGDSSLAPVMLESASNSSASGCGRSCLALVMSDHTGTSMRAFFLHESRRCVCRLCTSHLQLVKERDTNQATTEKDQTTPKTQNKPNQKRRQGSYLKKAETAEEAVRQSETRGDELNLGTQYMAFLSFLVFFYDMHPELEFLWVLMQKQAGCMAVYPVLKRVAKLSPMAGAIAASTTANQMYYFRTIHKLSAVHTHRM